MTSLTERLDDVPYYVWREGEGVRVELMNGADIEIVLVLTERQRDGLVYRLMNPQPRLDHDRYAVGH